MSIRRSSLLNAGRETIFSDGSGQWFATILALAMVVLSSSATPAAAQTREHTWVSTNNGDDINTSCGTFISPCRSISNAINRTAAGGEIQCMDPAPYMGIAITKSLTIDCSLMINDNSAYGNDVRGAIGVTTGPSDTVILRGLNLNGGRVTNQGLAIQFNGSGTLIVDNFNITNWMDGGIFFQPNGPAQLKVLNSHFANIGNFSTNAGAGIRIVPQGTGSARVQLDHVSVDGSVFGVAADGNSSTGGINITVSNSELNGNKNDGLIAVTSSGYAPIGVLATNTRSTNNAYGIRSIGPNVTVRVKNSEVVGNGTGLAASGGGALLSMGQNAVQANGTNGAFTGAIALE